MHKPLNPAPDLPSRIVSSAPLTVVRADAPHKVLRHGYAQPKESVASDESRNNVLLAALGERVRMLRARRGITRKALARAAGVSERHLANLEYGQGNPSLLVLNQVAGALRSSLAELVGDVTTQSLEWLQIREVLAGRNESDLHRARVNLDALFRPDGIDVERSRRIALIGLRGAGKSTLGRMLADDLNLPFIELSREIESLAGFSVNEIHDLYGEHVYRRYERRALEQVVRVNRQGVIATPGGLVSEAGTFNLLLARCTTVWLQADPDEHMNRVAAQGDTRPMSASPEAMSDLRRILASRSAFYSKADMTVATSRRTTHQSFEALRSRVRSALSMPV